MPSWAARAFSRLFSLLFQAAPQRRRTAWAVLLFAVLLGAGAAQAQVVNGNFSSGSTGWTSNVPSGSSLSYSGNRLTAVSDDNGGTNSRTYAWQTIAVGDPGFLTALLVSYIGTDRDAGNYDYPMVRVGGTYYWLLPSGALSSRRRAISDDSTWLSLLKAPMPL